ncbi:ribbon-helix-helix domain-containing protein [Ensifer aridi]|uniref:ribbon-helix-helix domain-containing protein n=1 Tax=Ensifer aridi TaxID=1708715 RepID=UPI0009C0F0A3|nr:ribbon-helix-helix domain-containing protein [Ensifer aridi]
MCKTLTASGPQPFRKISRPLRIAGHSTSICLESAFWQVLDAMAVAEGVTTPKLISVLHEEAAHMYEDLPNFASVLRTLCLLHESGR